MPTARPRHRLAAALGASLLAAPLVVVLGLSGPASAGARSDHRDHRDDHRGGHRGVERFELPDGFQPEGIEARGRTAYVGSRVDGDVWAADVRTGAGRVLHQGDGTPAVGLELGRGRDLWVAGGADGDVKVVDARTGRLRATYELVADPEPGESFVNDVVVVGRTAYVTDSLQAALYAITPRRHGDARVSRLPLSGDWTQVADTNNANGIETAPDGRALLVVSSADGGLYRVDPRTGDARRVDLAGTVLTNGDGLLREGRRLYVVQNRLDRVAELRLDRDGRSGRLVRTLTSPDLDVPSTIARAEGGLYLPNARFTTPAGPDTAYWVSRLTPAR